MKNGIACGGNWIIDTVKIVDSWPKKGELCSILSEDRAPGGSPFNILVDFSHLKVPFPTYGLGCIGKDSRGSEVRAISSEKKINMDYMTELEGKTTSYTDVMTLKETGERTFFHCRGSNAEFGAEHIPIKELGEENIKIFHLGYLLLLDKLDAPGEKNAIAAADVLESIQESGIETSLDIVSEASDRFSKIVKPCLPFVDHLIINEIEAGKITKKEIRKSDGTVSVEDVKEVSQEILNLGVCKTVIIHFPEGSVMATKNDGVFYEPSLKLPKGWIVGSVGAGDAFCAGALWGLHDGWCAEKTLKFATGVAASCLRSVNSVDGVCDRDGVLEIMKELES